MQRRTFLQSTLAVAPFLGNSLSDNREPKTVESNPVVINSGVGGNNTVDLLARIEKGCLAQRPELTILMAGTNDVNSKKHVPLPTYEQNIRTTCSRLITIRSQIVLMTILPVYEPYLMTRHDPAFYQTEGHSARKKARNDVIRKVASDNNLPLPDMHHIFETVGNIGLYPRRWGG